MTFTIKTVSFEGPLDVLLSLVEKRKLFINEISLSDVTEDYIKYVESLSEYSMTDRADFIVIASTLLLIKSRSLLPDIELTEQEVEEVGNLQERLLAYQKIKELSIHIKQKFGQNISFERLSSKSQPVVFLPPKSFSMETARDMLLELFNALPKKEKLPEVIIEKIRSLEEAMDDMTKRIQNAFQMKWNDIKGKVLTRQDKVNVIVTFLAMLELVKQGIVEVKQNGMYEDIELETGKIGVPRYM